jgi:hypothetical protein
LPIVGIKLEIDDRCFGLIIGVRVVDGELWSLVIF